MVYPTEPSERLEVTQIEAARRQLHTAIELWIADGDPVSIHTLAFCAYQIAHDLNRAKKGPALLLDWEVIPKDRRSSWVNFIKESSNFFKHADGRKGKGTPQSIYLNEELSLVLLNYAALGLEELGEKPTAEVVAFRGILKLKHPEMFFPEETEALQAQFAADGPHAAYAQQSKKAIFDDVVARIREGGLL